MSADFTWTAGDNNAASETSLRLETLGPCFHIHRGKTRAEETVIPRVPDTGRV